MMGGIMRQACDSEMSLSYPRDTTEVVIYVTLLFRGIV